jgi:hypothetical protein
MDANDFAFIEDELSVVLPNAFRQFMGSFPSDPTYRLKTDGLPLSCNGELFAIGQRQRFFNPDGVDYYELQPELRSRHFIEIGGDGCGNHFCMVGDDTNSDEVWIWEHDPYNGFSRCGGQSLTDYFNKGYWEPEAIPDPFLTTTGMYVLRANHPVRSILNPIAMKEWMQYIAMQDILELDENHVGKNPFTRESVTYRRWPGRAKIATNDRARHISFLYGSLSIGTDVSAELRSHANRIATDLSAHIWTDE